MSDSRCAVVRHRASSRESGGLPDCSRSPSRRKLKPTETRCSGASAEHAVPQWMTLPHHATSEPARRGEIGRAAAISNRTSVTSSSSSDARAGRMCAYAQRFV